MPRQGPVGAQDLASAGSLRACATTRLASLCVNGPRGPTTPALLTSRSTGPSARSISAKARSTAHRIGHVGRKGARLAASSARSAPRSRQAPLPRARHDGNSITGRRQCWPKSAAQPAATAGYDRDLHDAPSQRETMAMRISSPSPTLASCRAQVRDVPSSRSSSSSPTTWQVHMTREHGFAARLRQWRHRRGWSQLDLAARADISQRHLSFLELARAAPAATWVLAPGLPRSTFRCASTMRCCSPQAFAPVWRETDLGAPNSPACVMRSTTSWPSREPFPAVASIGTWESAEGQ